MRTKRAPALALSVSSALCMTLQTTPILERRGGWLRRSGFRRGLVVVTVLARRRTASRSSGERGQSVGTGRREDGSKRNPRVELRTTRGKKPRNRGRPLRLSSRGFLPTRNGTCVAPSLPACCVMWQQLRYARARAVSGTLAAVFCSFFLTPFRARPKRERKSVTAPTAAIV